MGPSMAVLGSWVSRFLFAGSVGEQLSRSVGFSPKRLLVSSMPGAFLLALSWNSDTTTSCLDSALTRTCINPSKVLFLSTRPRHPLPSSRDSSKMPVSSSMSHQPPPRYVLLAKWGIFRFTRPRRR